METPKYNAGADIGHPLAYPDGQDWSSALGVWFNFDRSTKQIARVHIYIQDQRLWMEAFGAVQGESLPWGAVQVETFSSGVAVAEIEGFTGVFDFGFKETRFCTNLKYGTLVIQTYNRFKDGGGRSDYFIREFFHQALD
jgi:hypothetical protein